MLNQGRLQYDEQLIASKLWDLAYGDGGRLDVMKKIITLHSPFRKDHNSWIHALQSALVVVCRSGNFSILEWLLVMPVQLDVTGLSIAADYGQVAVMQFLYDRHISDGCEKAMREAIRHDHLEAVQWLFRHFSYVDREFSAVFPLSEAVALGRLDVLQFVNTFKKIPRKRDINGNLKPLGLDVISWAARSGRLALLKFIQANFGAESSTDAMDLAAQNGHLDVVKWLNANRSEGCTGAALVNATRYGHFKVVKWLGSHYFDDCAQKAMSCTSRLEIAK